MLSDASYIPGYSGVFAILVLVIAEHFNITDPIETADAQQIVWLSRGLVISEVGISGTNCILPLVVRILSLRQMA